MLVTTLILLVIFLPLTALSTSEARAFEHSGIPNADIRGPRIVEVQQFFPPTCAHFPNCTVAPSLTENQSTIISHLAKNSSSTNTEFQLLKKTGFNIFVSLLTPKVPTDIPWIKKEQAFGMKNNVTVVNFPLSPVVTQNSKADVDKIVKYVESFKPGTRIYIHDFLGKERDHQVYEAIK